MADLATRLQAAKDKVKQLQARMQKKEARKKAQEAKQERAKDTRRKILLGAGVLSMVKHGEWTPSQYQEFLKKILTRPDDFALFGLPVPEGVVNDSAPISSPKNPTPKTNELPHKPEPKSAPFPIHPDLPDI